MYPKSHPKFEGFAPVTAEMAQVAQTLGKTFTDKIDLSDWPGFCREVIEGQVETIDKDKMILGTLNIISGVLPSSLYILYDDRRIFAPMYNILYVGFATKKGDLEACRQLVTPLKHEMRIFTHPLISS